MLRAIVVACALAAFFCPSSPVQAHQNPAEAAERCAERIRQIVHRNQNAAAGQTEACLQQIRRLLEAGRRDLAILAARECLRSARERTRLAIAEVRENCERCINYLLNAGAEDLAARLRQACAEAIRNIEHQLQRQQNAISEALQ